jgi:AcrR family transcriptional regulator
VSSQVSTVPRRELNSRQADTVEKLLAAAVEELAAVGVDGLTIRSVAVRAGVSAATAYTYFSSKNHLFAELFLRHVVEENRPPPTGDDPLARVQSVIGHIASRLAAAPEVAAGATMALLTNDLDVHRLRLRVGGEFYAAFEEAIGGSPDDVLVDALVLAFSGALLQAGMGLMTYTEMGQRLDAAVAVIMKGNVRDPHQ